MLKTLSYVLVTIIVVLICAMMALYLFQGKLIYPAPQFVVKHPNAENIQRVNLNDAYGYLMTPKNEAGPFPLIIFTHGNAELAEMWIDEFSDIVDNGYAVFLVEYPGYGQASGTPSYDSIKNIMLQAYDTVTSYDYIDKEQVIAYGRSLGGAAAALLAAHRSLDTLVLESSFSSLPVLVKEKGLPSFLLRDRYNNEAIVRALDIPILIYHGKHDRVIPFSHAQTLKRANPNAVIIEANCGHNNCPRIWHHLMQ